jgi:hypothetical protein
MAIQLSFSRGPLSKAIIIYSFKVLKPNLTDSKAKIKCPPAVRIGICPSKYSKNVPLGQDLSIGYKGSNGKVVYKGGGAPWWRIDQIGRCPRIMHVILPTPQIPRLTTDLGRLRVTIHQKRINTSKMRTNPPMFFTAQLSPLFNYASIEVRYE